MQCHKNNHQHGPDCRAQLFGEILEKIHPGTVAPHEGSWAVVVYRVNLPVYLFCMIEPIIDWQFIPYRVFPKRFMVFLHETQLSQVHVYAYTYICM